MKQFGFEMYQNGKKNGQMNKEMRISFAGSIKNRKVFLSQYKTCMIDELCSHFIIVCGSKSL